MGICNSCESISTATAKLILHDGRLLEFSYPVKASHVLRKNTNSPPCFICNSDDMDFDGVMSAVADDEELQPGQLYFALPMSRLGRRLRAEEMAALAVKASSALGGMAVVGGVRRRRRAAERVGRAGDGEGGRGAAAEEEVHGEFEWDT